MMMSLEVLGLQMICMHLVMLDLMSDAVLEPAIPRVNCCFTWYMSVESIVVVVVKCENPKLGNNSKPAIPTNIRAILQNFPL